MADGEATGSAMVAELGPVAGAHDQAIPEPEVACACNCVPAKSQRTVSLIGWMLKDGATRTKTEST